eukprot:3131258-Alexandrium_andersonii.AAC.1
MPPRMLNLEKLQASTIKVRHSRSFLMGAVRLAEERRCKLRVHRTCTADASWHDPCRSPGRSHHLCSCEP